MKIILKSKLKKLGDIGSIVDVKDGYAKNYLLPNGYAIIYTDNNYKSFAEKKETIEKENNLKIENAKVLKSLIEEKSIDIIESSGDDGRLYGSVNKIKIANIINSIIKKQELQKSNIVIHDNIKTTGKYIITIELHPEVFFKKELFVGRSKEDLVKIKQLEKLESSKKKEEQ